MTERPHVPRRPCFHVDGQPGGEVLWPVVVVVVVGTKQREGGQAAGWVVGSRRGLKPTAFSPVSPHLDPAQPCIFAYYASLLNFQCILDIKACRTIDIFSQSFKAKSIHKVLKKNVTLDKYEVEGTCWLQGGCRVMEDLLLPHFCLFPVQCGNEHGLSAVLRRT